MRWELVIRSETLFRTPSVCKLFLGCSRPRFSEVFAESVDDNSFLDLSINFFLEAIEEFLLACEVTLGTMAVFFMLELLRSWKLDLAELSAVVFLLEKKGRKVQA